MSRLTVRDVRASRIPQAVGINAGNLPQLCGFLNEAQERLIKAGGESGWWGGWAKMVFNVDPANPYITAPREVARIINLDICRQAVRIQNEFYEFLEFGYGLNRQFVSSAGCSQCNGCQYEEAYDRGTYPTTVDITAGMKLRVYLTNSADAKKRLFYAGKDTNGQIINTIDQGVSVQGDFITFDTPFADSAYTLNELSGLQKEATLGPIRIYGVAANGAETFLATLAATETNPAYRRYFLNGLPKQCMDCDSSTTTVQVVGIAKLEFIPVSNDTDFLLIGNIPALKNECLAVRYSEMDTETARKLGRENHNQAIKILNEELTHYLGRSEPAVNFAPFGKATLQQAGLSTMI